METRVIWTLQAATDLETIFDYYVLDESPAYASRLMEKLWETADTLTSFATRGRIVPEANTPLVREILVDSYRLIYEIGTEAISVLSVIHISRDLPSVWSGRN